MDNDTGNDLPNQSNSDNQLNGEITNPQIPTETDDFAAASMAVPDQTQTDAPKPKKNKLKLAAIISAVILLLGGGGAAAYMVYENSKPENILAKALADQLESMSNLELTIKLDKKKLTKELPKDFIKEAIEKLIGDGEVKFASSIDANGSVVKSVASFGGSAKDPAFTARIEMNYKKIGKINFKAKISSDARNLMLDSFMEALKVEEPSAAPSDLARAKTFFEGLADALDKNILNRWIEIDAEDRLDKDKIKCLEAVAEFSTKLPDSKTAQKAYKQDQFLEIVNSKVEPDNTTEFVYEFKINEEKLKAYGENVYDKELVKKVELACESDDREDDEPESSKEATKETFLVKIDKKTKKITNIIVNVDEEDMPISYLTVKFGADFPEDPVKNAKPLETIIEEASDSLEQYIQLIAPLMMGGESNDKDSIL